MSSSCPCACGNSTFATPVDSNKASTSLYYPKDNTGEAFSSDHTATVFRCRTFSRKIHRLSVRVHRMDYQRYADVVHHEPPPPYEDQYEYELPATSAHELPDGRMLDSELEGDHVFAELDGFLEQTNDYLLDPEAMQASYSDSSERDERGAAAMQQPAAMAETPMLLRSLNTQDYSASAPSMTSGGQSLDSSPSPISPVTPHVNGVRPAQVYSDANRPASTVSPLESLPADDVSWPRSIPMDTDWNPPSQISLSMPLVASHMESFQGIAQHEAKRLDGRQDDTQWASLSFGLASQESYVPSIQPPPASGQSLPELCSQRHDATGIRFGTYECSDHQGWQFRGGYEQDVAEVGHINYQKSTANQPKSPQIAQRFGRSQGLSTNFVELDDHQYPQICERPEQGEIDFPLEHCDQCDKTFRGR